MKNYVFYNPNPLQKFHKDGTPVRWKYCDCTVRALSKTENISWKQAYEILVTAGMNHYMMPNDPELLPIAFKQLKYVRHTFKAGERMPLKDFARRHKNGVFLVRVQGHIAAVVNGKYYDAWDCGDSYVTSYFEKC